MLRLREAMRICDPTAGSGSMAGVVMPHGILFRGGAEGKIRRGIEDALAQLRDAERRRDEAVVKMDELLAELGFAR